MAETIYDVMILGAGPAGLQAAIHAGRRKASVLVVGKTGKSSAYNAHIDNFCCLEGRSGGEMLDMAKQKAEAAGAVFCDEDVMGINVENDHNAVALESGGVLKAHALVLAMGVSRNRLGLANEKECVGKGVSYCVDCDGPLFRENPVAVAGCGSAAVSGALTMMFYTDEIHLVCEKLEVGAHLAENLRKSDIVFHEGRRVTEIKGRDRVTGVVLDDGTELAVNGLFIEQGAKGAVELAGNIGIMLDETMKYIAVNKKQETNLPGVYAAGDICGPPWQVAKAVGEGCVAGLEAAGYVRKRKQQA
ncbi:MAG: FAD-dependent oxidoreductase [Thermodesulfobacteriota bacterium]|nr:FAD-dependent oxidoreductase [Thermodesulfobacteriota bacterium]